MGFMAKALGDAAASGSLVVKHEVLKGMKNYQVLHARKLQKAFTAS
jgi:hypothetical protein